MVRPVEIIIAQQMWCNTAVLSFSSGNPLGSAPGLMMRVRTMGIRMKEWEMASVKTLRNRGAPNTAELERRTNHVVPPQAIGMN